MSHILEVWVIFVKNMKFRVEIEKVKNKSFTLLISANGNLLREGKGCVMTISSWASPMIQSQALLVYLVQVVKEIKGFKVYLLPFVVEIWKP